MPSYLVIFDRGRPEMFEACNDAAARDYVRELLYDEGAEEGDGGNLYREAGGDEEFIGEVRLGDDAEDDAETGGYGCADNVPGYPGPCPDGMDWGAWLAFNNVD
jgi:hypothetical protein